MDLHQYVSSLQQSLAAVARSGSEEVQRAAEQLSQSIEPALRLSLMELASDLAADVTSRLDGDVVDVRLRGGVPEIVVQARPRAAEPELATVALPPLPPLPTPPPSLPGEDEGGTFRISLRIPEALKGRVDDAATAEGLSVNTWLVRAIQQVLAGPRGPESVTTTPTRTGRRMTGWVR